VGEQEETVASLGSQLAVVRAEAEARVTEGDQWKHELLSAKSEIGRLSAQVAEMQEQAQLRGDLEQLTQSLNAEEFRTMLTNNLKVSMNALVGW
jgi:chromosome segregation ATPase